MRKTLARYRNGNYEVVLLSDGTKIRFGKDGEDFDAEFPESIDLNITDWCDVGCDFCYRGCTADGIHHRYDEHELWKLDFPMGMEVALGGGSPIKHPDLDEFCRYFGANGCFPNITVHWSSVVDETMDGDLSTLMNLQDAGWLYGVGVSTTTYDTHLMRNIKKYLNNGVVHLIAGIVTAEDVFRWVRDGVPVLLLGYKNMGRGLLSSVDEGLDIADSADSLGRLIVELVCGKGPIVAGLETRYGPLPENPVLTFDNLALKQLELKSILPEDKWNEVYMGDDGVDGELTSASMYLDLVSMTYARNSVDGRARPVGGKTTREMFSDLKKNS